jgi:hypothetical protein
MLLVVTGIGLLIHIYSLGYMDGDARYERFFAYLNLFVASMLILVLGSNLLTLFLGWELVGLSSYLLIGFWFEQPSVRRGGQEGVHHQPRRRRVVHDRDVPRLRDLRDARLPRTSSRRPTRSRPPRPLR